ncbi:MAG: hypothetical protein ACRCR5_01585 [Lactococcus garvieae]
MKKIALLVITMLSLIVLTACSSKVPNTPSPISEENSSVSEEHSQNSQVDTLLTEYDSFIQKIRSIEPKVSEMNDMKKVRTVTDLVQEQLKISTKYEELKDTELTADDSTKLMDKSFDMLQEYNALITKLQE